MSAPMNPTDAANVAAFLQRQIDSAIGSPESVASLARVADHLNAQIARMTGPRDDGGPAFPHVHVYANQSGRVMDGMTQRDYFAAHVDLGNVDWISVVAGVNLLGRDCPNYKTNTAECFAWWAEYRSKLRFMEADAMLKARQQ